MTDTTPELLLTNLALLDVESGALKSGLTIRIRANRIAAIEKGERPESPGTRAIDLGGRTVMPGMIDCHVHILHKFGMEWPRMVLPSYVTAHAGSVTRGMLGRGFTTVRDAGGADAGHRLAQQHGFMVGPRLFVSGRAISQTGGHGDPRTPGEFAPLCDCAHLHGGLGRLADGEPEVRRAARDEIRLGCDQVKIMASGGIASQTDPIDYVQYSQGEIDALCDEARRARKYVMAHAYTAEAISRCVDGGVRSIEHGNLIDEEAARRMATAGAYLVPTLVTYRKLLDYGKSLGRTAVQMEKNQVVLSAGVRSLEIAKAAGVKMAYGTDLVWAPQHQAEEFLVRAEVLTPIEIIRSATLIGAELIGMAGRLGVLREGALADLIVIDGDPTSDLGLLQDQGAHLAMIIQDGKVMKDLVSSEAGSGLIDGA